MKFSVDQESVADIIASLTSYSDDIDAAFNKFQNEIKTIVIRTNYNKLLVALKGIIDIYNDVICGSMRSQLISIWLEEGESLHAFAEDVYMGEESEEAVRRIESSLEDIFISQSGNSLFELEFEGDSNAEKEDFDEAVNCFEAFKNEIELIKQNNSEYFDNKIEDNELYRFLVPIVEAIGIGITSFCDIAKMDMDRLGDNYVEKIESLKKKVEEAKSETKPVDFDLDLFDFDDEVGSTMGLSGNSKEEGTDKKNNSIPAYSKVKKEDKSIQQYKLIQAIREFDGAKCRYPELKQKYDRHLAEYHKKLEIKVKAEYDKRDIELKQYYKQLEKQLSYRYKALDGRYINGTITLQQAEYMYSESCMKADQLYSNRKQLLLAQYNSIIQQAQKLYDAEVARCNNIANNVLKNQQSLCRELHTRRQEYIDRLSNINEFEATITELKNLINNIDKHCVCQCDKLKKIKDLLYVFTSNDSDEGIIDYIKGISDDIKRELSPLNVNLKQFKRRNDSLSWAENLKATNPEFSLSKKNKDGKYTRNCQRCVIAYEARCRGFDVTAKEKVLDGEDELSYMERNHKLNPNGWLGVFEDKDGNMPIPQKPNGNTIEDQVKDIERQMALFGNGARAIIRIQRITVRDGKIKPAGGHVFIAEQINGKTIFCDPQTGSTNVREHNFGNCKGMLGCLIRRCKPECGARPMYMADKEECNKKVCNPRCLYVSNPQMCRTCYPKININNYDGIFLRQDAVRYIRIDNLKITEKVKKCCL